MSQEEQGLEPATNREEPLMDRVGHGPEDLKGSGPQQKRDVVGPKGDGYEAFLVFQVDPGITGVTSNDRVIR